MPIKFLPEAPYIKKKRRNYYKNTNANVLNKKIINNITQPCLATEKKPG